ncbi:sulfotransferase [Terricaulis sp.]|uniref:tetratricopeptide repeat-containing sulfotransferase family protein n=1 Tax=Terricaulis sp. TaxID=2768686 RepID=UPI003784CD7E
MTAKRVAAPDGEGRSFNYLQSTAPGCVVIPARSDEVRTAADAVARAAEVVERPNPVRRIGAAQLDAAKQLLMRTARQQLALARDAMLQAAPAGLPGLPQGTEAHAGAAVQAALAIVWNALGELETLRGDADAAVAAYRSAIALAPDDVFAHAQLAEVFESRHDVAAAMMHARKALRGDPTHAAAGIALARCLLREGSYADAEGAALAATKARHAEADEQALAWTLAGEARDRMDNARAAFESFNQANRLMRQRYGDATQRGHPAHPANVRALTNIVETSSAAAWRGASTHATPAPAFLIGFPRSGTTLIEQALSSHPEIVCLGETEHLFEALSMVLKDGDLFARIGALTVTEIETIRAAYRDIVRADHPDAAGRLVVDKHPLHITILPLIHKVFPDAKIVLAGRDPRDVVLSCYQQCFGVNVATMQFWDLRRAADYYDAVMGLLAACREKFHLDLLEMDYRDVVADFEGEMRRLAAFLGLPFAPAMLRYQETARRRTVTSASARQVIQPIYASSLQRWRRYARELAPVLPLLNAWARRLGYEV